MSDKVTKNSVNNRYLIFRDEKYRFGFRVLSVYVYLCKLYEMERNV